MYTYQTLTTALLKDLALNIGVPVNYWEATNRILEENLKSLKKHGVAKICDKKKTIRIVGQPGKKLWSKIDHLVKSYGFKVV